jgi:hypothetical protein
LTRSRVPFRNNPMQHLERVPEHRRQSGTIARPKRGLVHGEHYGKGRLPRLLILSADPGGKFRADPDGTDKTIDAPLQQEDLVSGWGLTGVDEGIVTGGPFAGHLARSRRGFFSIQELSETEIETREEGQEAILVEVEKPQLQALQILGDVAQPDLDSSHVTVTLIAKHPELQSSGISHRGVH